MEQKFPKKAQEKQIDVRGRVKGFKYTEVNQDRSHGLARNQ